MDRRWISYFLSRTLLTASMSKDPSTQVGALIVNPELKQEVSSGYNGFPRLTDDNPLYYQHRPTKYKRIVHAEANAIASAARLGISTDGCYLFCTHMPCSSCAGLIINAGIKKVYICGRTHTGNDNNWCFDSSQQLFSEAGIEVISNTDNTKTKMLTLKDLGVKDE